MQIRKRRDLVREILSRSGAPQKRVQLGRNSEMNERQARTALDDIIALLNRNPAHAQGAELVRRFVEQVYIPQKYENGDWRKATGQEAEHLFRRSILSEIGEMRRRDLKAEHLRAVQRKLAGTGLSYESVSKVRFAMGDMVKRMVAEEYLVSNIAAGLKTPTTARRSDRSRLRRVTLTEYLRAWTVLDERERLAFDLVTFCGLRESEAYGVKNGDLFQQGAIRVERSWTRAILTQPRRMRFARLASGPRFSSGFWPGSRLCRREIMRDGSFRASGL